MSRRPVADALATADVPTAGVYRVWVRTRNWADGAPGRFLKQIQKEAQEIVSAALAKAGV